MSIFLLVCSNYVLNNNNVTDARPQKSDCPALQKCETQPAHRDGGSSQSPPRADCSALQEREAQLAFAQYRQQRQNKNNPPDVNWAQDPAKAFRISGAGGGDRAQYNHKR